MENSNDSLKMIGALLVGAAVGGVLGVLFAPAKGSQTRKRITGEAEDVTSSLKEKFDILVKETIKQVESAKKEVSEFSKDGKGR